jgi:hypothetical protein
VNISQLKLRSDKFDNNDNNNRHNNNNRNNNNNNNNPHTAGKQASNNVPLEIAPCLRQKET